MAEPNQSSLSEEKTSVIGSKKEEKETMFQEIGSKKEEKETMFHEKETHGTSEDIDEKTKVDEVKGPGVLERMKEEVEAIVDAVIPTKSSDK